MRITKFVSLGLIALSFSISGLAQVNESVKIKTGDSVVQERLNLDVRGREIFVASKFSNTAVVDVTESGKTFSFQNGIVVKYDNDYAMTYLKALDGQESSFAGKYLGKWKPKDLTVGKKEPMVVYRMVPRCGEMKNDYDDVRVSDGTRTLTVGTEEKTIPVSIVEMSGMWSGGSCGSGKVTQKVTYSASLDLLLGVRVESFDSRGFLNAVGSFETSITALRQQK